MRNIAKNEAERLINRYGLDRALEIASNKAIGAMTNEEQNHWFDVAVEIKGGDDGD